MELALINRNQPAFFINRQIETFYREDAAKASGISQTFGHFRYRVYKESKNPLARNSNNGKI